MHPGSAQPLKRCAPGPATLGRHLVQISARILASSQVWGSFAGSQLRGGAGPGLGAAAFGRWMPLAFFFGWAVPARTLERKSLARAMVSLREGALDGFSPLANLLWVSTLRQVWIPQDHESRWLRCGLQELGGGWASKRRVESVVAIKALGAWSPWRESQSFRVQGVSGPGRLASNNV